MDQTNSTIDSLNILCQAGFFHKYHGLSHPNILEQIHKERKDRYGSTNYHYELNPLQLALEDPTKAHLTTHANFELATHERNYAEFFYIQLHHLTKLSGKNIQAQIEEKWEKPKTYSQPKEFPFQSILQDIANLSSYTFYEVYLDGYGLESCKCFMRLNDEESSLLKDRFEWGMFHRISYENPKQLMLF